MESVATTRALVLGVQSPCQLCGSTSIDTDEVNSPAPKFRTLVLRECKRCHHRWTGAVAVPQLIAQPVSVHPSMYHQVEPSVRVRTAAVRVRPENAALARANSHSSAQSRDVARKREVALAS